MSRLSYAKDSPSVWCSGVSVPTSMGQRLIFPYLFSVVGDYQETGVASATYSGANVQRPCSSCWVQQDSLHCPAAGVEWSSLSLSRIAWRTEPGMTARVMDLKALREACACSTQGVTKSQIVEVEKAISAHPVEVSESVAKSGMSLLSLMSVHAPYLCVPDMCSRTFGTGIPEEMTSWTLTSASWWR